MHICLGTKLLLSRIDVYYYKWLMHLYLLTTFNLIWQCVVGQKKIPVKMISTLSLNLNFLCLLNLTLFYSRYMSN